MGGQRCLIWRCATRTGIGPRTYRTYPVRSGENIEDIISKRGIARAEVDALNPEVNLDKLQGGAVPAPRLNCAPCRLGTPICIAGSGMVSRVALLQHEEEKVARQVWDGDNSSVVGPELVLLALLAQAAGGRDCGQGGLLSAAGMR